MKKFSLMALSILGTLQMIAPAFGAEDRDVTEVPRDAVLLYQNTDSTMQRVTYGIKTQESNLDLDFECQTVFYKWEVRSDTACGSVDFGIFTTPGGCLLPLNWIAARTYNSYSVTAYCQQRSYDQKVIVSLERRCEQNPTAECLDEKVKAAIATLQHTSRYDIGKP